MKKSIIFYYIIFITFCSCFDVFENFTFEKELNRTISTIKSEFDGKIINKYSTREISKTPTRLTILTTKNDTIDISPNGKLIDKAKIGDGIKKLKNENIVQLIDSENRVFTFYYILISKKERNHKKFPKEWKKKWMNSTIY